MFIVLTLASGNSKRFNVHAISSYVRYDYTNRSTGYRRTDDVTSLYTMMGKRWTVQETPEQIDEIINASATNTTGEVVFIPVQVQEDDVSESYNEYEGKAY